MIFGTVRVLLCILVLVMLALVHQYELLLLLLLALLDLLAAKAKELLKRHDLIVELNLGLREDAVSHHWVAGALGELTDFVCDSVDFLGVIMLSIKSLYFLVCVLLCHADLLGRFHLLLARLVDYIHGATV